MSQSLESSTQERARRRSVYQVIVGWLSLLLLVLTMSGCNTSPPMRLIRWAGGPSSVRALRTSTIPDSQIPPFQRTVTDAAKAQSLYDALQSLPPYPRAPELCPKYTGEAYYLTFSWNQREVYWAVVEMGGCSGVILPNGDTRVAWREQFWVTFAHALDVSQADLFQGPVPGGPSAPLPPPGPWNLPTHSESHGSRRVKSLTS